MADTKFNGVQLGWDKAINKTEHADTYIGVTAGYGKGDIDNEGGSRTGGLGVQLQANWQF